MPTPRRSAMPKIASRWPSRSPSMPTGSRPPTQVGALGDRLVEQLGRARRAQDAALREGDDLDGDEIAEALADLQDLRGGSSGRAGCRCRRGCACAACRWPRPGAPGWRRSPSRTRCAPRAPCARPRCGRRRVLPAAWLGTQGRPSRVLSRWMWPSTSGGRTSAPRDRARPHPTAAGGRRSALPDLDVVPAAVGQRGVADISRSSAARPWWHRGSRSS